MKGFMLMNKAVFQKLSSVSLHEHVYTLVYTHCIWSFLMICAFYVKKSL